MVSWIGDAGFEMLSVIPSSLGSLWFGSGKWKKLSTSTGKEKSNDDSLLQASTQAAIYECITTKGEDWHDTDGSLSLGEGKASGRVDVPVGVQQYLIVDDAFRSSQSFAVKLSQGSA